MKSEMACERNNSFIIYINLCQFGNKNFLAKLFLDFLCSIWWLSFVFCRVMQNLRELWVCGCKINIVCGGWDYFVADNVDNQFDIVIEMFVAGFKFKAA